MINQRTLLAMGLGLAVASIIVGLIVFVQRGSTPRLVGEITKVRTLEMDASSCVAIVDFHLTNDSRYAFLVKSADLSLVNFRGEAQQGRTISAADATQLFAYYPDLGAKTAEPLIARTRIAAQAPLSGMLAARFEIPKSDLDARRKIILTITEVDGAVSEIAQ